MDWRDVLMNGFGRIPAFLDHVLSGLGKADVNWQPRPDANSIGWLVWHLTRQQDGQLAALMDAEQLWVSDGWCASFGRPPDPGDHGFGHTPADLAAFVAPGADTLLAYQRAVHERTVGFLRGLSSRDLDRQLDEPWFQPLPTVGVRLVSILDDAVLHAGQAAYVRGLRQGKGWQQY